MANFRSKDVLAVSATVIAGLLILTTLQAFSTNPILSKVADIQNNLDSKNIDLGSDIQTMNYLKSELTQINDTDRKIHIQNQIDDLQTQIFQLQAEINGLQHQDAQWVDQTNQLKIARNIQALRFTVLGMIMPFALAIASEADASLRPNQNHDEMATPRGKRLLFLGGFILMIGLFFIFTSAWF